MVKNDRESPSLVRITPFYSPLTFDKEFRGVYVNLCCLSRASSQFMLIIAQSKEAMEAHLSIGGYRKLFIGVWLKCSLFYSSKAIILV